MSPLLANLFLHDALDVGMARHYPQAPFARYADAAVVHCWSEGEADRLKAALAARFADIHLAWHPTKTRIVYCQDDDRRQAYPTTGVDFLGYTFRPRRSNIGRGRTSSTAPRRSVAPPRRRCGAGFMIGASTSSRT